MQVFYDERYVAAGHSFDTTRKSAGVAVAVSQMEGVVLVAPMAATPRELALVHAPQYIRGVRTGKGADAGSAGFGWDPGLWTAVSASTGGVVDAALAALEEGVAGSLSSGLHHADREGGAGFCTFNGLAMAAKVALGHRVSERRAAKICKRVLILDLDAHCGGGTYSIIKDDTRIWQIDISVCSFDGYVSDSERHHLHVVRDPDDYLDLLELELERAAEIGFDLVIYNAGMDPHEDCGIGGLRGITSDVIRQREEMVFSWAKAQGIPIAFVLAGGYTGRDMWNERLSALHGMTVAAAAGCPMPDIEAIEAAAPALSRWTVFEDGKEAAEFDEEMGDLSFYAEPWEEEEEERKAYKSIHDLPQGFFEIDDEALREEYPEFFEPLRFRTLKSDPE